MSIWSDVDGGWVYHDSINPDITDSMMIGGNDVYTTMLLRSNYADGLITFKDIAIAQSTTSGRVITPVGNIQNSTLQRKYGPSSFAFDGNGSYLSIPDSSDFYFGANDFTIDAWVYFNAMPAAWPDSMSIVDQFYTTRSFAMSVDNSYFNFSYSTDGTTETTISRSWIPSINTWYHLAVVRSGTLLKLFVNGVQIGTDYTIGTSTIFDSAVPLFIGAAHTGDATADGELNGYIDELRISKIARWTSNFAIPLVQYTGAYKFTGLVDELGSPVARLIRAYLRSTGQLVGSVMSSPTTGSFTIYTPYSGEHYVIALDDTTVGSDFNAIVYDRIVPVSV